MGKGDAAARRAILERRARFVAAALVGLGLGAPACTPPGPKTVTKETDAGGSDAGANDAGGGSAHVDETFDAALAEVDSDGDGIPDAIDGCPTTPGAPATGNKNGCPQICLSIVNELRISERVHFEPGVGKLIPANTPVLDEVVHVLAQYPNVTLRVQGHCDQTEPEALGEQRAKAVLKYLVDHGIAAARLEAKGYGKTVPIAPNTTTDGRAMNRRVDFARTDSSVP